jgi:hypothetical protein
LGSAEELQSGGRDDDGEEHNGADRAANDKATRHSYKSRKELQQEICYLQMKMEKRLDRFRTLLSKI